jgi:hypothetical protein
MCVDPACGKRAVEVEQLRDVDGTVLKRPCSLPHPGIGAWFSQPIIRAKSLLEDIMGDRGQHAEIFCEKMACRVVFEGRALRD